MLEVENLWVRYGTVEAVRGISFSVQAGSIVSLIGSNGAGKTTSLRALTGLVKPGGGALRFESTSLVGLAPHQVVSLGIAHVPEGRRLFPKMTVLENLTMGAYRRSRADVASTLTMIYEHFPILKERGRQLAGSLSGGEQQMLAIARALMTNPRLIILDEATEGLAPLIRDEIWRCLTALKRAGQSILVIDKNVEALIEVADRHYVIERGRVTWSGTSNELAAAPDIQRRYLGI